MDKIELEDKEPEESGRYYYKPKVELEAPIYDGEPQVVLVTSAVHNSDLRVHFLSMSESVLLEDLEDGLWGRIPEPKISSEFLHEDRDNPWK